MEHRSFAPDLFVPIDDNTGRDQLTGEPAPNVAQEELLKEKQMGGSVNCNDLELLNYLQALGEGFLATYYSDTKQSVQSKSMSIASRSFRRGKKMVVFHGFPSLQMSKSLTDGLGAELLTLFQAGFRARTSAQPEKARELPESAADCGQRWRGSLAKYDPVTRSLKTAQLSLLEGLTGCSLTLPKSGWMRDGDCFPQPMLVRSTRENESGYWLTPRATETGENVDNFVKRMGDRSDRCAGSLSAQVRNPKTWPTPTVCGNYNRPGASATSGMGLASAVKLFPTPCATDYKGSPTAERAAERAAESSRGVRLPEEVVKRGASGGQLNPTWVEWLMGWPIGHTDLKPLGTGRFQEFEQQHGGF